MQKIHGYTINIERHALALVKRRQRDPYYPVEELPSLRALSSYPRGDVSGKQAIDTAIEIRAKELSKDIQGEIAGHSSNKSGAHK